MKSYNIIIKYKYIPRENNRIKLHIIIYITLKIILKISTSMKVIYRNINIYFALEKSKNYVYIIYCSKFWYSLI